jgi:uncharacterized protein (TIGR02996 family)
VKLEPLLAAVYADPASDEPRAVYADALVEKGHPLGELIQLQLGRRKGKVKRAKEIFDPAWWNDLHPLAGLRKIELAMIERGFPARLDGVSATDVKDHAGWSTIRVFHPRHEDDDAIVAALVPKMPILEDLIFARPATLAALARAGLPIRRLHAEGGKEKLPSLARLAKLERLEWHGRDGIDEDLDASLASVGELDVLGRIRELHLLWTQTDGPVRDALAALERIPKTVEAVRLGYETYVEARRDAAVEIVLDADEVPSVALELAKLPATRIESLSVAFGKNKGFTKKNREPLAIMIRKATKQFKKRSLALGD